MRPWGPLWSCFLTTTPPPNSASGAGPPSVAATTHRTCTVGPPPLLRHPVALGVLGSHIRKHLPFPPSPSLAEASARETTGSPCFNRLFPAPPRGTPISVTSHHIKVYFSLTPQPDVGCVGALLHAVTQGPRLLPSKGPLSPGNPGMKGAKRRAR